MPSHATATLQLQGRLVDHAHAAQRKLDAHGHFAPTLCFEIQREGGHQRCIVEQFYPVGEEDQCQAAARQLKKGALVSFHVDTDAILIVARGVSHLERLQPGLGTPCPAVAPQLPLLEAHA